MVQAQEYSASQLAACVPVLDPAANKYSRGVLTAVAGSAMYPGAACLAAAAAQRMGAGYVQVVTDPSSVDTVRAFRASLVVRSWEAWGEADLRASTSDRPCAYVVGPGFSPDDPASARLALLVLEHAQAPVLVDGGALGVLATEQGRAALQQRFAEGHATIVTPHAGEAARLAAPFNLPTGSAPDLAQRLAWAYGVTAVLKGPETLIADGDDVIAMREGTPALAKAGTGDVLAGMIGALLAQGTAPVDAAVLGATLHARAARQAEAALTDVSVIPEDVIDFLPAAIKALG